MKKNYHSPSISVVVAEEELMQTNSVLINQGDEKVGDPDEILSRRNQDLWKDDWED